MGIQSVKNFLALVVVATVTLSAFADPGLDKEIEEARKKKNLSTSREDQNHRRPSL